MDQLDLTGFGEGKLMSLLRAARTREQSQRARAALKRLREQRLRLAVADFDAATREFTELADELQGLVVAFDRPDSTGGLAIANTLLDATTRTFAAIRDPERLGSATDEAASITLAFDEEVVPPIAPARAPTPGLAEAPAPPALTIPPPAPITVTELLPPRNSRDYAELEDEYVRLFEVAGMRAEHAGALAFYTNRVKRHRPRYEAVADAAGGRIPWYFIACIHALESSFDFNTHLFNGDPLTARTVRVPKGQPAADPADGVRYRWEESALAAMRFKELDRATDWSLPRMLYRLEGYNGFGYRSQLVPTPYLWSFSTLYDRGRFVRDHVFDRNAESRQAGAATIIKKLALEREIALPA